MGSGSSKQASSRGGGRGRKGGGGGALSLFTSSSSSCFGIGSHHKHHQRRVRRLQFQAEEEEEEIGTSSESSSNSSCSESSKPTPDHHHHHHHSLYSCTSLILPQTNKFPPQPPSSHAQSGSTPSRSRPRFSFISDGFSSRLSRAVSLGSSAAAHSSPSLPPSGYYDISTTHTHPATLDLLSSHHAVPNGQYSHTSHSETDIFGPRPPSSSRRLGHHQHLEGSVRFSRTLSVGRLRDRVLRRSSYTEGLFGPTLLESARADYSGTVGLGRTATPPSSSNRIADSLSDPSSNTTSQVGHDYDSETSQYREATDRDLLEHRSAFLERRRRIRSQVRALQRLGSRFENSSGHDRSCILSGQHRTGRCMCRTSNTAANPDEGTSTRASISRIVMLAEALFEVLDEIHQQSVVLSSRPSFSSIGSIPAPKEVVEHMPVKVFVRSQRQHENEECAQCYICLVEYEEGDLIRVLPCHHEFHQMCIDKWLKEIHRVCPLCRGDVCRSEFALREKF